MKKVLFCVLASIFTVFSSCRHDDGHSDISISGGNTSSPTAPATDTLGDIVARIQQQSKLYTTECRIHKVVLFTDEARIGGKMLDISLPGYRKAAVPIDVTIKGYVDFANFAAANVLLRDSLCIITLPDPKVVITSSKVDHKATRQYVSLTRSKFSEAELSELAAQGADTIARHITDYGIEDRSRETCARIIVPLLAHLGYKEQNIVVRFRKHFDDAELRPLSPSEK